MTGVRRVLIGLGVSVRPMRCPVSPESSAKRRIYEIKVIRVMTVWNFK